VYATEKIISVKIINDDGKVLDKAYGIESELLSRAIYYFGIMQGMACLRGLLVITQPLFIL